MIEIWIRKHLGLTKKSLILRQIASQEVSRKDIAKPHNPHMKVVGLERNVSHEADVSHTPGIPFPQRLRNCDSSFFAGPWISAATTVLVNLEH